MSFISPFILLALLFGGEDSLSGYVNPEQYWESRGIAYDVDTLSGLLGEPKVVDENVMQKYITQLAADVYGEREAASQALAEIGLPAKTQLMGAAQSRDPEVARRAQKLLRGIKEEQREADPVNEWMVLHSLSRMNNPEAEAVLKNLLDGPDGELKQQTKTLLQKNRDDRIVLSPLGALVGFPADTRLLLQMKPDRSNPEVLKAIHSSPAIQNVLVKFMNKMGDIKVHRITLGINDGVFVNVNGRVSVRVEMDYDTDKIIALLEKGRFEKIDGKDGAFVYSQRNITIALGDDRHLVLFLDIKQGQTVDVAQMNSFLKGNNEMLISESLLELFEQMPETSVLSGVGEFSAEMMEKLEDFSEVRRARFTVEPGENPLAMALLISTTDTQTATAFGEYAKKENNKILELLGRENEDWVKPMMNTLETLEISQEENRIKVEGSITGKMLLGTVGMIEKMMSQMTEMRQRHEQRNHQHQIRR